MFLLADLVLLRYFWATFSLRRRLRKHHPDAMRSIMWNVDPLVHIGRYIFPKWWNDCIDLQHFCMFQIDQFPVLALADDKVFVGVKRIRGGVVAWLYATALGLVIASIS